jgi:DUF1680 family protein
VLERATGWVKFRMDRLTHDQQQAMLETEFGGMNEVLANLYAVTHNPQHLQLAKAFDHDALFGPLAAGRDPLDGLHANTQIPKMIGAAREFELTGDPRYHDIAATFWTRVVKYRSYANGGHSDDEHFFPVDEMPLHLGTDSSETCNTYNMLKLTRHLFSWAPSADLMDYYERGLYNHILASQDPSTGGVIYYCPLRPGAFKTYSTRSDSFWCCVGTGMENHAKYPDSIYFHTDDALFVNLYIPSELTWKERGIRLRQETGFPATATTRLTVSADRPTRLAIKVRYPSWATDGLTVNVNGQQDRVSGSPGSYVTILREWKTGDVLAIDLPMRLRVEPMPGAPKTVAIFYGPILLAGDLGQTGLNDQRRYGPASPELARLPPVAIPGLVSAGDDVLSHIKPVAGQPLTFRTDGLARPNDVTLVPFFRAAATRYTVYWRRFSPAEWTAYEAKQTAAQRRWQDIEARTVDLVDVDSVESEKGHALNGSSEDRRPYFEGKQGRDSRSGEFGYTLKVATPDALTLVASYRGGDARRRAFDILVDGRVIASERLPLTPDERLDREYEIPKALVEGKSSVAVTFKPHYDAWTGAVLEVRTVRRPS